MMVCALYCVCNFILYYIIINLFYLSQYNNVENYIFSLKSLNNKMKKYLINFPVFTLMSMNNTEIFHIFYSNVMKPIFLILIKKNQNEGNQRAKEKL